MQVFLALKDLGLNKIVPWFNRVVLWFNQPLSDAFRLSGNDFLNKVVGWYEAFVSADKGIMGVITALFGFDPGGTVIEFLFSNLTLIMVNLIIIKLLDFIN